MFSNLINRFCVIRTHSAGVHFGTVAETSADGTAVRLTNARRVHYWEGAASLSQMASEGIKNPEESRVSVALGEIILTGVIEYLPCTAISAVNLQKQPVWKV